MAVRCELYGNEVRGVEAPRRSVGITMVQRSSQNDLLAAFKHLRDSDIHQETISHAFRHSITQTDVRRDFVIEVGALERLPAFQDCQYCVDILVKPSLLELSRNALDELRGVVKEGARKGYLGYIPSINDEPTDEESALSSLRTRLHPFIAARKHWPQTALLFFRHGKGCAIVERAESFPLRVSGGPDVHHLQTWTEMGYEVRAVFCAASERCRSFS
jgi:hypothetical protein